jgi:predicted nucleic acid binding AN1-type Zn finger protein
LLKNWLEFYAPEQGTRKMNTQEKIPKRCQCNDCRMKLNLTTYPCRCGKYFCSSHRYSEDHNCTYDFKAHAKKELLKTMSTPIIAGKVGII